MTVVSIVVDFVRGGWELEDSGLTYPRQLLIGHGPDEFTRHLSIGAWESVWDSKEPLFDLYDDERNLTLWVRGVPTPQRAAELLDEHGLYGCAGFGDVMPEDVTVDAW
jgi:hypothetical protein